MAQGMVFEDIFNVKDIDPNGKQFDRGKFIIIYFSSLVFNFGVEFRRFRSICIIYLNLQWLLIKLHKLLFSYEFLIF